MGNTWFVSDTHFGHKNIIKYSNRPFNSVEEMDALMIQNWNKLVKPNDTVYHLGDFAFGKFEFVRDVIRELNGKKHLILGNHDKIIREYTSILAGAMSLLEGVCEYREVNVPGTLIVLAHYGHRVWNKSHRGSIHLYGHSHGTLPPLGKSVDVGVDAPFVINRYPSGLCPNDTDRGGIYHRKPEDYRPVSLDEVMAFMQTRTFTAVDRHGE